MSKYSFVAIVCSIILATTSLKANTTPPFTSTPLLQPSSIASFISVKATIETNKVFLNWDVIGNEDVDQFIIESTEDNISYTVIAFVFGTDTQEKASYKFFQKTNNKQKAFRIKLITKKGEVVYSSVFVPVSK
jgi:hypothetical protein